MALGTAWAHPRAEGPSAEGLGTEFATVPQPSFTSSMAQPAMLYRTSCRQAQRKAPMLLQGSSREGASQPQTPLLPLQPDQSMLETLCSYSYHLFISQRDKGQIKACFQIMAIF